MGNATAVRSFALSGGAAGSLVGAVLVVLIVLGAILAFNGSDRSATGAAEQSVAIQGAPQAAAQAVAPATEAVASTPAPIPVIAATDAPLTTLSATAPLAIEPAGRLPTLPDARVDRNPPSTIDPPGPPCVLGAVLPQCLENPANTGDVLGGVTGGLDQATKGLLGIDLGLQGITEPLGNVLNDPLGSVGATVDNVGKALRPPVKKATDSLTGTLNVTLYGVNGLLQGLTGNR